MFISELSQKKYPIYKHLIRTVLENATFVVYDVCLVIKWKEAKVSLEIYFLSIIVLRRHHLRDDPLGKNLNSHLLKNSVHINSKDSGIILTHFPYS